MVFKQLYNLDVHEEEFIPFGGMGEDRFLGGVAEKYQVDGYDAAAAKALFFDIYINTFAKPEQNIGYPGGQGRGRLQSCVTAYSLQLMAWSVAPLLVSCR